MASRHWKPKVEVTVAILPGDSTSGYQETVQMTTGVIENAVATSDHAWRFHDREAGDDAFVALAASLGAVFAPLAADHDRENTFVYENFDLMRDSGCLRLAVPRELGGLGATMRQVCFAQAELARHC